MLKESGIKSLIKELEEIADVAAKEYNNEKNFDNIEEEWDQKKVDLSSFKIPNSFILTL